MPSSSQPSPADAQGHRIGIAGLGKIGAAMAARLAERGCEVIAWNRDASRVQAAGLDYANSPCALADACHVVITSLFDIDAVKAVYGGSDGLTACATDTLFIEMSTVSPASQRRLSLEVAAAGGRFIECPVSGTVSPARSGQLLGLAGGSEDDVEAARPTLAHLCRRIVHVGEIGAGARTKLAVNLPLIAFWQSFGEAMALMRHVSDDPDWLVELFADTAGAPAVMKVKAEALAATLGGHDTVEPAFDIDAMRKDLKLALAEAAAGSFTMPVARSTLTAMDEASAAGWGRRDCAWMPAFWAGKAVRD
ncbi:3-hydroxyisobutyrate dehydrogenase [Sphingomonas zeicaulis]|uniref:NAD(P)-dependent oxidoreductase n=1 Tax=Sphingomonas zeicaulis TaxID=1632740 RepID=UPI003D2397CD